MKNKTKDFLNYSVVVLVVAAISLICIALFTVLQLTLNEAITRVSRGDLDFSYLALFIISAFLFGVGAWCFSEWTHRRTYIFVSESHLEVTPVDRRDAYFDLNL